MKFNLYKKYKKFSNYIFILLLLIILVIFISFDNIFISKKLKNINQSTIEAYSNYVNICKSKPTQFYELNTITGGTYINKINDLTIPNIIDPDISDCNYYCDNNNECDLFTISGNICKLYNLQDLSSATVNCSTKPLPGQSSYFGEGYISNKYLEKNTNNINKFTHRDYLLDEANNIITQYTDINSDLRTLESINNPREIENKRNILQNKYNTLNSKLSNLAQYLDLSKNMIFSDFVNSIYSIKYNENVNLQNKDISYIDMLDVFYNLENEERNNEERFNREDSYFQNRYLIYMMLLTIMVITIIILSLYKFVPDLISDLTMLIYFFGIISLVFILHNYFDI